MLSITGAINAVVESWVDSNESLIQSFLEDGISDSISHNELVDAAREACGKVVEDLALDMLEEEMYEVISQQM